MLQFLLDEPGIRGPISRRRWLAVGGLAGLGACLSRTSPAGETRGGGPGLGRAKSVILVLASGGQSQIDTWDPKPDAPREVRGAFETIATAVPGTFLTEHMPRLARAADKYTIVRSMAHEDLDHGSAFYLTMTGRYHNRRSSNPEPSPADLPTFGSIFKRLRPNAGFAEPAVHINGPALVPAIVGPGQNAGLLGRDYDPMVVGDVLANPIVLPGLAPQTELTNVRLDARKSLVEQLDRAAGRLNEDPQMTDMDTLYRRAFEMLSRSETRQAFDLEAEPAELRRRYGMNRAGQACLLARRLVEAGVPLITVFFNHMNRGQDVDPTDTDHYGWDTHNDIFFALKKHLLPRFDLGFTALLDDLDARGLLDETLVVCLGEFGRAPLVAFEKRFAGASPGRKHWASVYSIVAAGAGVQRGAVLGSSNRQGGYPTSESYGPWDVLATIFSALGIDPAGHYLDATDRPFPISIGRPIAGLYGG